MDLKFKPMKKLFITAATAILFSVTAFAADGGKKTPITGEDKISYVVLSQFDAQFSTAKNPAWTVTSNLEKVTFRLDGAKMTAFYDLSGEYLGTTQTIAFKNIPYYAQEDVTAKYAGYTVKEVIKYETNGNPDVSPVAYFVDLQKTGSEVLVKVIPGEKIALFKTIK
jgi:hypothetical protein